jgi:hypothetical protein
MPEHEAAALLGTSHFRVLIGREELGFADVSPLSSEADPESGEQFACRRGSSFGRGSSSTSAAR